MKLLIAMLSLLCCHQVFGSLTDQDKAVKAAYNPTTCETKYLNQNVDNVKRWATSPVSSQYFDLKVDSDTYTPGTPLKGWFLSRCNQSYLLRVWYVHLIFYKLIFFVNFNLATRYFFSLIKI